MNKAAFGIIAVLALAIVCFAPMADYDGAGQIYHEGTSVIEAGETSVFEIVYTLDTAEEATITYSATVVDKAGNVQASAVSPSTGSLESGEYKTLTVTAPSNAGKYTLKVEFLKNSEKDSTEEYAFSSVTAKTLTVNLKTDKVTLNMESFGVFFYVDGEKLEDSYSTVTLSRDGTGSVSYDWIADPAAGQHTFYVEAAGSVDAIKGLSEVHTFYIGDNDYTVWTALAIILLIALIIWGISVYRKPVKNFGKPKARR